MERLLEQIREYLLCYSPLRNYQVAAVCALFEYFMKQGGNPLVAMPTGTGKSLVIAWFVRATHHFFPHVRVQMLTHVKKLIQQNFSKLLDAWPTAPAGIYSAGLERREFNFPIIFGGIASVDKVPHIFVPPDIIIIDEAHLVSHDSETMYRRYIAYMARRREELGLPALRVVGLSATCYRMGLGSLVDGGIFTDVCFDMTTMKAFNWLIQQGFLAPLHAVQTEYQLDVSAVRIIAGEYAKGELQAAVDKRDINEIVLEETYRTAFHRQRWMLFAAGTQHADHLSEILNAHGIAAVSIHSKMDKGLHDERFEAFQLGQVRCAISMNEMTTGVDIPEIDYIGMLRHTKSTAMWVQMLGRGTRPAPRNNKSDCLVGDYTTNTRDLGPINDPVLPHRPQPKGKGGGGGGLVSAAPIRVCPNPKCKSWVHASFGKCPYCGTVFPSPVQLMKESAGLPVMRTDDAIVEEMEVLTVTYNVHHKKNRPDSMVVSYHCVGEEGGNIPRRFREYICFEHEGIARTKARNWWRDRCPTIEPPDTVQRALDLDKHLRRPKTLRVWVNKTMPEIMSYGY